MLPPRKSFNTWKERIEWIGRMPMKFRILFGVQAIVFGSAIAFRLNYINSGGGKAIEEEQQQEESTTKIGERKPFALEKDELDRRHRNHINNNTSK
mmetsp:Transcript_36955/g.42150  ORF Transcript_36955/g.42150 Transcript_36955/m.42150 type:complete len:96 (+) Transcript_36955:94-381(+)